MKIYIGSDHRGNELRSKLVFYVIELGYECKDLGTNNDFPLISQEVTKRVLEYNDSKGILICGTGQGMAMASNRYFGIRAAVCNRIKDAKQSREHLDANVLTIGADLVKYELAKEIVKTFLSTKFSKKERYERRIKEMG